MNKLISVGICLLIILSTAFCLTGCKSRTDEMADQEIYTEKQMNKMKNKVIKCINEQDKEGLKKLFSKDAQKHIEDLDGKLDQLIGAFNGNKIESAKGEGSGFEGSVSTQPIHIYEDYNITLNNGDEYTLFVSFCDKNDNEPEKVGLIQIELRTFSSEKTPKDFSGGTYKDDYGIFIYTLQNYPKK